ncbi:MAG TPA: hypothetical protein VFN53_13715 [Acidobacteriaceae bacterium]|nr:hypothetical protein [Acidobacteriaceae bacterium]
MKLNLTEFHPRGPLLAWTVAVALLFFSIPLHAKPATGKNVHLHGTLIDMTCWNDRSGDTSTLLREHTKRCLQMPDCIRSGYAVVTPDGQVYKMDAASNDSTTKWIAATPQDANWRVDVKGRVENGLLDVKKIQLQK